MTTVSDVELKFAHGTREILRELGFLPDGYDAVVRLHGRERGKRRTAEFPKSWSPETDSITITFEPTEDSEPELWSDATTTARNEAAPPHANSEALTELIKALDRAEARPGYDFVSLKWFRDTALVAEGFAWVGDNVARQELLREAIDKRLIITHRVANPKSPQFPVTAIRLNRSMPEVKAIFGIRGEGQRLAFQPIAIRGEALSATVLRDRR
ncbi:MAG TPA: hypothetical protein VHY56_04375 [Candidatus Binataceae bacterium]|jgi:hypothetical protein|nr:hypothetical protein [Candidatus Binataceae bacterium]